MSQRQLAASDWIGKLNFCLQELVDYERDLESKMSSVRWQIERHWGMPSGDSQDWRDNVRHRVSRYSLLTPSDSRYPSEYREYVSEKLRTLIEVLLEHPAIAKAADFSDGQWRMRLDLGVSRVPGHQMIFMLIGLVEYALEYSPEATANALADLIQRGYDQDLNSY